MQLIKFIQIITTMPNSHDAQISQIQGYGTIMCEKSYISILSKKFSTLSTKIQETEDLRRIKKNRSVISSSNYIPLI